MYKVLSQSSGLPAAQLTLCKPLLCLTAHTYSKQSAVFDTLQPERLSTRSDVDFVSKRTSSVVSELLLYFAAIGSKHTSNKSYCVPSSAHPPAASSYCIPLTLQTQLSIQSIIDTNGAGHMYSSKQELPLPKCILNYSEHERYNTAERGHQMCNQSPIRIPTWAHDELSLHEV